MDKNLEQSLKQIIDEQLKKAEALENAKVKIAISGQSGSGKSSIINAIFGEKVAKVGSVETTFEKKSYTHNGTDFYDLPGCGTKNFPVSTYIKDCDLVSFDAFIIVTANRFYENDEWLINEMVKAGRPVYVVRSKMDEAIINEKRDNDLDDKEVYKKVKANILESVDGIAVKGIYLIASVEGVKNDFEKLLEDIENSLDETKKKRFLSDIKPYNKKVLEKKREIAGEIISNRAWLAAANGINPIPGLDVSVDITLLINLAKKIRDTFGLDEEQVAYATKNNGTYLTAVKQFAAKFIAREGILLLLKRFAVNIGTKEVAKYIPFLGQAIAAGIGYKMTYSFGVELLEEAYDLAEEILASSANDASKIFEENNTIMK